METNSQIQPDVQLCRNTISYREEYVKIVFPLQKHYDPDERFSITSSLIQNRTFPKDVDTFIHEKFKVIYEVLSNYKTNIPPQYYYSIYPHEKMEKHSLVMVIYVAKNSCSKFFKEISELLSEGLEI